MREGEKVNFNEREIALILSALSNDTVGIWGDDRSTGIKKLINKIGGFKPFYDSDEVASSDDSLES